MPQYQTWVKMIQYFSRLVKTPSNRLMKKVYLWDKHLNESNQIKSWSSEVKSILYSNSLAHIYDAQQIFPVVKQLSKTLQNTQQIRAEIECKNKPKLRTFITFKDFNTLPPHVYKPLSFFERKIVIKFAFVRRFLLLL